MSALFKKYLHKAKNDLLQNDVETALKAINSALHCRPDDLDALRCKVDILRRTGRFQGAAECLISALDQRPHHTWWAIELAELMINRLNQPAEAIKWLGRVFHARDVSEPEERRAFRLQAEALIDQERPYEAWLVLRKACSAHPNDLDLLFLRGWVTLQLGRYYASASTFQKLLRLKPEHVDAQYYLGVAYEGMEETGLMIRQFSNTHKLDQLFPPEVRHSTKEFRRLAEKVLEEIWQPGLPQIRLYIRDYPDSSILDEAPHDPRRMGMLTPCVGLSSVEHMHHWRFTLYHWNLERFCFTPQEIQDEITMVLQQEMEDKGFARRSVMTSA